MKDYFESKETADAALSAFWDELKALKAKHHLENLYVIVNYPWGDDQGEPTRSQQTMFLGDEVRRLPMVTVSYGVETERHKIYMNDLVNSGRAAVR